MDSVFQKYNVIIAHCLTKNGGAGNVFSTGKNIYQRIDDVFENQLELSCSTIQVNDTIAGQNNFFGPIGIILKQTNVTYVNSLDCGSFVTEFGKREYVIESSNLPTENNIENSILNRSLKGYNELCVNQYNVFGFFLCSDDPQYLSQNIQSEAIFYHNTSKHNLPYFNLSKGILYSSIFNLETNIFQGSMAFKNQDIYK